jgi:hypothetical protein
MKKVLHREFEMKEILLPRELDRLLRYPVGKSKRLAEKGLLPCIRLPDGEIRFDIDVVLDHLNIVKKGENNDSK